MKTSILFAAIFLLLYSCSGNQPTTLVGKWKMTEELIDIGDGKGTFKAVDKEQVIEFFSDGTFSATHSLCPMISDNNGKGSGTYSLEEKEIKPANCSETAGRISFEVKGGALVLHLPCIEPCQQKFVKES